jgi:hypothetical protein
VETASDSAARFYEGRRFRLVYDVSFSLLLVHVVGTMLVPADRVLLVGGIAPVSSFYYRSLIEADGIASPPRSLFAVFCVLEAGLVLYAGQFPSVVYAAFNVTGL